MEIKIRKTERKDAEQVVKLKNAVWKTAYAHIMPQEIFDENDRLVNEKIERQEKQELNSNGCIDLVACVRNKVIALAHAEVLSRYEHYRELGYADLMAIYIDQEYQKMGVGKKLFDKIVTEFKKLGHRKMVIGVLKDNFNARRAYEKWGGKLDNYEAPFIKNGMVFSEVFYIFEL